MHLTSNATVIRVIGLLAVGEAEVGKNGIISGPMAEILKDFQFLFNFSFKTTWIDSVTQNPFQEQIISRIVNEEFDLASGYFYLTPLRVQSGVLPLMPLINEKFTAYFRQPHFTTVRNIFVEPFTPSLFFAYFALSLLLLIFIGVSMWTLNENTTNFKHVFQDSLWLIIAVIGLKDCKFLIQGRTLKILFITGSLFFLVIYSVYSAFITSALKSNIFAVKSIADFIKYEFTFLAPLSIKSIIFSKHYKEPRTRNRITDLESFQLAIKGGHVHVDDQDFFLEFVDATQYSPMRLCTEISTLPFPAGIASGFYVPRGSAFKDLFNQKIAKLTDAGLIHRLNFGFRKERVYNCPKANHGFQENLGLSHVLFAFVLLSFGVLIVIILFLLEILTVFKIFQ